MLILTASVRAQTTGDKSGNTEMSIYKNPDFSIGLRVEDLLSRMTLEEKIGQINMPITGPVGKLAGDEEKGMEQFIKGELLEGVGCGGGFFGYSGSTDKGASEQAKMINKWQKIAKEDTRLGIPLLFIVEGTHGALFPGPTIYPQGPVLAVAGIWIW